MNIENIVRCVNFYSNITEKGKSNLIFKIISTNEGILYRNNYHTELMVLSCHGYIEELICERTKK